ncbi:Crp/Fnr family transcriptional regulator [Sphingomonas sp. UV9]|uniref:Crp/Fnr family transcriptional regulator n=1 Tax=Sphingomonas sp. UV9 TaxID=1851410 RepID=UPI000FFC6B22|nr:Crp/Fnr family transcriptional regulator [Sphingomonas sp. UV9]RXD07450.1 Crp/Fnr family transcriptional regulator [Sphingomonas sp. UV9]
MNVTNISPLVCMADRLALHAPISVEDRVSLLELPYASRIFEAGSYLLRDGDTPDRCGTLVSGLAYRHKISVEGLRQIVSIHIPGEVYDLQQLHLATADNNVQALTRCEVVTISHKALRRLAAEHPSIAHALIVTTIVELSIAREWMLGIGRRDARTRIAHLLCEFAFRLDKHGLPPGQAYELPMTQEQLADALGLTAVHVNRILKGLVSDGLIVHSKRGVTIPDWEVLVAEAGFNSRYLHMNPPDAVVRPPDHA